MGWVWWYLAAGVAWVGLANSLTALRSGGQYGFPRGVWDWTGVGSTILLWPLFALVGGLIGVFLLAQYLSWWVS